MGVSVLTPSSDTWADLHFQMYHTGPKWSLRKWYINCTKPPWGLKHFYDQPTSTWVPMIRLIQKIHKNSVRIKAPNSVNASKRKKKIKKIKLITVINKEKYSWQFYLCQSKWKPTIEQRRAKPKTYRRAPTHWLKFTTGGITRFTWETTFLW